MPSLAPHAITKPFVTCLIASLLGALLGAPLGRAPALWLAVMAGAAFALARPHDAPSPGHAVARATMALTGVFCGMYLLFGLGVGLAAEPELFVALLALRAVPALGIALLLLGPLASLTQRVAHSRTADGATMLALPALGVATLSIVQLMAQRAPYAHVLLLMAGSVAVTGWVVAVHVRLRRSIARLRRDALEGHRLRFPATAAEREHLPTLLSGFGPDAPVATLLRVETAGEGAYRAAPTEVPIALVPAIEARPALANPAVTALGLLLAQAMILLLLWT